MLYELGILAVALLITNVITLAAYFDMRKQRNEWYNNSVGFSDQLQSQKQKLDQKWEDILDEGRV